MKQRIGKNIPAAAVLLLGGLVGSAAAGPAAEAGPAEMLWQIGKADNDTREFALAPKGHSRFSTDPVYVVGLSEAKKDWPYAHPGPTDGWAGSRRHTFTIVFGLKAPPTTGPCRLDVDLVDTHGRAPPRLRIAVNGRASTHRTPAGGGDASILGDPSKGRQHRIRIDVPAGALQAGANQVTITTLSGSWVLYDWIGFEAPPGLELTRPSGTIVRSVEPAAALVRKDGRLVQTVKVNLVHLGEAADATVHVSGAEPTKVRLRPGANAVEALVGPVEKASPVEVRVKVGTKTVGSGKTTLKPVRKWVVYLLPHSHVDIGYTKVQTAVERDHWRFYEQAIEASRKTAGYPPGARFKWNVEVLWATDSYLKQASPAKRKAFIEAVKAGWIGLDALYGNELTALCRPEELVRLTEFACRLRQQYGVPIDSAMISDVPGYTWGVVGVLARSGVKYFSIGPNGGHRIGYTLSAWADQPFWWVSPCGRHRVLAWIPRRGYWQGFRGAAELTAYLRRLEDEGYPYEVVQIRHCLGDNAGPGVQLCEFVRQWNAKYAYPRLVIATTREMFLDFERRYGDGVQEVRGDFTPYWEDGAASSALETALNRAAAESLVQAETLWAMLDPAGFPDTDFYAAWRNVILYDEHTWGAHNSISQPDSDFARAQWKIKQAFAVDADAESRKLLAGALARRKRATESSSKAAAVDVFNTTSWPRTDLVVLSGRLAAAGDAVKDEQGRPVPSQRLSTGELALVARDVPPLAARRFRIEPGPAAPTGRAKAHGTTLTNGTLTVTVDEKTGTIASLRREGVAADLVDRSAGGLNHYLYVAGRDPKDPRRSGPARVAVKERGPLVASLTIISDAPGCTKLTREVRVVDGLDRVDIVNVVDKQKVRRPESVHFGFPFAVPKGVMRMDVPWAVVRPEADQIRGACKNYFTVQRWVDVSNDRFGVTWATVDAPLVEVGGITVDPRTIGWIKRLSPSATFYSYVMNNYWETNYKADQSGPTTFRYSLRPHGAFDPVAAQRFGIERSQPLIAAEAGAGPVARPPLLVEPAGVIVTAFKPSRDGKAWIVRLFNVSARRQKAVLKWSDPNRRGVCLSTLDEDAGREISGPIELAPLEFVTLRAPLDGAPRGQR